MQRRHESAPPALRSLASALGRSRALLHGGGAMIDPGAEMGRCIGRVPCTPILAEPLRMRSPMVLRSECFISFLVERVPLRGTHSLPAEEGVAGGWFRWHFRRLACSFSSPLLGRRSPPRKRLRRFAPHSPSVPACMHSGGTTGTEARTGPMTSGSGSRLGLCGMQGLMSRWV